MLTVCVCVCVWFIWILNNGKMDNIERTEI